MNYFHTRTCTSNIWKLQLVFSLSFELNNCSQVVGRRCDAHEYAGDEMNVELISSNDAYEQVTAKKVML